MHLWENDSGVVHQHQARGGCGDQGGPSDATAVFVGDSTLHWFLSRRC